ncbi:winged helix domain-containing protein [Shinella sp.]|uniref:winged helix domain-containing protein n=1 Tax=Shinella sp. TaxID=1870904 RepID=UPI003F729D35
MTSKRISKKFRILPDGRPMTIVGRDCWALENLIRAGNAGCTPIDQPGPRWSHYVFKLRRFGFVIETIDEAHAGAYPGHHARYVLRSDVICLDDGERAAA